VDARNLEKSKWKRVNRKKSRQLNIGRGRRQNENDKREMTVVQGSGKALCSESETKETLKGFPIIYSLHFIIRCDASYIHLVDSSTGPPAIIMRRVLRRRQQSRASRAYYMQCMLRLPLLLRIGAFGYYRTSYPPLCFQRLLLFVFGHSL